MAREFWFKGLIPGKLRAVRECSDVLKRAPESTWVLETFWRRRAARAPWPGPRKTPRSRQYLLRSTRGEPSVSLQIEPAPKGFIDLLEVKIVARADDSVDGAPRNAAHLVDHRL